MDVVLLASNRAGVGKTSMAAALVARWSQQGHRIAYLRVGADGGSQETDTEYLAELTSAAQQSADAPSLTVPRINPAGQTIGGLDVALANFASEATSLGYKLVVEVSPPQGEETRTWTLCSELANASGALVVAMVDYAATTEMDRLNAELRPVRQRLGGLLVNATPPYRTREAALRLLGNTGAGDVHLLGVVPEDRMMLAPTVGQLATHLKAQWVLGDGQTDDLVCHVLIGGNLMDPGVTYFGRHQNQAVVVRGDRPDIQLAALGSELACLVLTGGHHPIPYVHNEAQQQEVPLLVVESDTHATAASVGGLISRGAVHHRRKANHYAHLLEQHCQTGPLQELLG